MDSPTTTTTIRRLQCALKNVFIRKPEDTCDPIQTKLSDSVNNEIQKSTTLEPMKLKYRHAKVETEMIEERTTYYGTDDCMSNEVHEQKMASKRKSDRKAKTLVKPLLPRASKDDPRPSKFNGDKKRMIKFERVALLIDAASRGDIHEVQCILDNGMHPDSCTSSGTTALHCAVRSKSSDLVCFLLSKKVHVNAADATGTTPLHLAALNGSIDLCRMLVEAGASVEAINEEGQKPGELTLFGEVREYLKMIWQRKMVSPQVTALFDFNRHTVIDAKGDEISLRKGDMVKVLNRSNQDWWFVETVSGKRGFAPRILLQ